MRLKPPAKAHFAGGILDANYNNNQPRSARATRSLVEEGLLVDCPDMLLRVELSFVAAGARVESFVEGLFIGAVSVLAAGGVVPG
jgi:hypothetical protein